METRLVRPGLRGVLSMQLMCTWLVQGRLTHHGVDKRSLSRAAEFNTMMRQNPLCLRCRRQLL
jgi:hypothetical protein